MMRWHCGDGPSLLQRTLPAVGVLIIALFYTEQLTLAALLFAGVMIVVLLLLSYGGVMNNTPYIIIDIALWLAVLKSGIHATIAGVILALFIPLRPDVPGGPSPLRELAQCPSVLQQGFL
jgi:NhaA family Na+:H+ antiporter